MHSLQIKGQCLARRLTETISKPLQRNKSAPALPFFGHWCHSRLERLMRPINRQNPGWLLLVCSMPVFAILVAACAAFGPYHGNTAEQPFNSVRGPTNGRYKLAFIEFGDQGSALDNSQIKAALEVIHQAPRPVLFVYIHGWQNNADSGDVCHFEHFLDSLSRVPEATGNVNVIGVYIAWRGRDLTFPGLNLLTF